MKVLAFAAVGIAALLSVEPASAFQFGHSAFGNWSHVFQSNPWTNITVVNQPTPNGGNASDINQAGNGNAAVVTQSGHGNVSIVNQSGGGNFASVWQIGKGNSFSITQSTLP